MKNDNKNFLSINDYRIKLKDGFYTVYLELDDRTIGVIKLHENFLSAIKRNANRPQSKKKSS